MILAASFESSVLLAGAAIFYYALSTYHGSGPLAANTNFVVREGAGIAEIASSLERNEIIEDARVFRYVTSVNLGYAGSAENRRSLKAGEYEIKAHASMQEIADLLESGKSILYSISMPEGLIPPRGPVAADVFGYRRINQ